jgi:hypothetical protein
MHNSTQRQLLFWLLYSYYTSKNLVDGERIWVVARLSSMEKHIYMAVETTALFTGRFK